jgi:threonine synthase
MALDNQDSVPTVAVATASPEKFSNVIAPLIETSSEVEIDDIEEYLKIENDKSAISESIKAYFS